MIRFFSLLLMTCLLGGAAFAGEVNVLSARHYGSDQALWDAFTRSTGIKVNVVEAEHDQLVQRLKSEGAGSPADVLITVDAGRLSHASDAGLLQPVRIPSLDALLPAHLRHPDGNWYGLAVRARVLVYHKDRINPSQIQTYESLADPRLKGKLLLLHGMVDDNVHPTNAWQLVDALQRRNIPFEMLFFPDADHGVGGPAAEGAKWSFLLEHLGLRTP